jgi:hypothetical protein
LARVPVACRVNIWGGDPECSEMVAICSIIATGIESRRWFNPEDVRGAMKWPGSRLKAGEHSMLPNFAWPPA